MSPSKRARQYGILAGAVAFYAAGTIMAKRLGYSFGRNVIVRCRQGHLFTTTWIPGGSLKAVRLGFWRLQWCPVGRHVALVHPVKDADLTDDERRSAAEHPNSRIP
jgi:hypothetical protein